MPIRRHLPPFTAIRAFEAAARQLSFRGAAEETHVTPSAISHSIRTLEEHLGTALFVREANRISLTPKGEAYLADLTPLLDQLQSCTDRISRHATDTPVRVLSTPAFAARWLIPRLDRFAADGDIDIHVSNGAPSTDFTTNGVDMVVQWGKEPVPGVRVEPFMNSCRYPVASPALIASAGLKRPGDLLRVRLLRDDVMDAWDDWFRLAGVRAPDLRAGPRFAHCDLTLTAAEQGQGVALSYSAMVEGALHAGSLVRLFDIETAPITIYSLAYPESRARCSRIRAFRDWIFAEAKAGRRARRPAVRQAS